MAKVQRAGVDIMTIENAKSPGGGPSAEAREVHSEGSERSLNSRPTGQAQAPNKLEAALAYVTDRGVFPAPPGSKRSYKSKKNSGTNWGATRDPDQIKRDWKRWPDANIGVPTGAESGIFVVDVDTVEGHGVDGHASLEKLVAKNGLLPETLRSMSGTGSVHHYFKHPGGRVTSRSIAPGVDIKGDGGMVLAPPSVQPGQEPYRWLNDLPIADAPQWLLEHVLEKPREQTAWPSNLPPAEVEEIRAALEVIPNPNLDWDDWNRVAMAIYRATDGSDEGYELFCEWSKKSKKHTDEGAHEKWYEQLSIAPPERIGIGTLFFMADEEDPNWRLKRGLKTAPRTKISDTNSASKTSDTNSASTNDLRITDFVAYMPTHNYIYTPAREHWPASSVNSRLEPHGVLDEKGELKLDSEGAPIVLKASVWLDQNRPVEQMTWAPGEPMIIRDRLISNGGWIKRPGAAVFNLYRPPTLEMGDASRAGPWLDHLRKIYPDSANHVALWFAWRVQRPEVKINHALVLGSHDHGIGKDTLIEPVKRAVGHWNFDEVSPQMVMGRFNGFLKNVMLRINEARDLGDVNRYQFYDHMKAYTASPPDVLKVDEKFLREHHVLNCVGIIITSNHKTNGIYLPAEDRRHYVAWSECKKEDFGDDYWNKLWGWYDDGGDRHVAAYLRSLDLKTFDPKRPPPKTRAFYDIVDANRAPEDSELADVLDAMGNPDAITLAGVVRVVKGNGKDGVEPMYFNGSDGLYDWLTDRKNRRLIPHRFETCGYVPIRNDTAKDSDWKIEGKRQTVYAKKTLSIWDQIKAAQALTKPQGPGGR
jgi:bifunctional DNA primase/polymerase-like protein/primase-like protein/uncharacterized protein DUF5906